MYFKADITYVSVFPQLDDDFASFVMLMRRQHLDNTTFFFVFPKRVILKRENNNGCERERASYSPRALMAATSLCLVNQIQTYRNPPHDKN
jgi:hypothetical protein